MYVSTGLLRNPNMNYFGLKKRPFNKTVDEMIKMKEYGIRGDYQTALFPYPAVNSRVNSIYGSKFGSRFGNLDSIGIRGDYQTAFFPYPAINAELNAIYGSKFGKKRKTKRKTKRKNEKRKAIGYVFYTKKGYGYHRVYEVIRNGKKIRVDNIGRRIKRKIYKTKKTAEKESIRRFKALKRTAKRKGESMSGRRQKFRI